MKSVIVLLIVICICLMIITWRIFQLDSFSTALKEDTQLLVSSTHALIAQNSRLEQELINLRKEIQAVKESFPKR
ncbi:MAG: hypothetical protein N2606_05255 [Candidatus Omnitrophica bacterium]|nr:hypothetical protein [Candidatus Omnitrophota bacterium]